MVLILKDSEVVGCQKDGHSTIYCEDCQVNEVSDCPNRQNKLKQYIGKTKERLEIAKASDSKYRKIAIEIAELVSDKQIAYGDSFGQSYKVLQVLYPDGVRPEDMKEFLTIVRVVDKLFRLSRGDQGDESAWTDIMGYALLSLGRNHHD